MPYSRCKQQKLVLFHKDAFLAHLSRRQASVVRRTLRRTSYVVVRRRPHFLNIFSAETTGPIKVKFHIELRWDGGTKVCSNGPGHMTKMADMPIYDKNLKKNFFSGPKRLITLKLGMYHRVRKYYQICTNDDPGLTLTYFMARSNLVPNAFVWERGNKSDKKFLLTSKLCPLGAVCSLPWGYIHVLNHEKMYQIRLQRDFFETCNKWVK